MRYSIETAPRDGKVVILEDIASVTFDVAHWSSELGRWVDRNGDPSKIRPTHWFPLGRDKYLLPENGEHHLQENEGSSSPSRVGPSSPRSRWPFAVSSITAAFVVATLVSAYFSAEVAAYVMRHAGQQNILRIRTIGEQVAQTLLPSQRANLSAFQQRAEADLAYPQAVAQEVAQAKQAREASAPRQSLDKDQRAEVLANELAQARRAINRLNLQLRTAAANSTEMLGQEREKTAGLVQAVTAARHELEDERARGAELASELAMARRETEPNVALLNKARDEAVRSNQTPEKATTELQQERDSFRTEAANFAQLLGQERERAATIAQEAAAARQELAASTAQHRQALDEERARGAELASEFTAMRTEIETQAAQLLKISDETGQLKQEVARSAQSLEQERERTVALAQETAVARQELIASTAQHRQALEEERARGAELASELAMARSEIEALLYRSRDEAVQFNQTPETTSELQQERDSLRTEAAAVQPLEQGRTVDLAQDAATEPEELTASTSQHRQSRDEERAHGDGLAGELATVWTEIETQAAQLCKGSDETRTRQLEQITELTTLELQQERDSLRTDAANSAELIGQEQQQAATFVHAAAAARHELDDERAGGAARDVAKVSDETETLLNEARDDAVEFDQTPEMTMAELQHARDSAEALWMAEESALGVMEVRTTLEHAADSQTTQVMQTADPADPEQPEATVSQNGSEAARLMVRARGLLGQGDIGAARIVLEHVAETGSAQASFALAETYDPIILFTWGTYGTRGDAMKARELYAKAHAGGIREAKTRFDALDQ